MNGEILAIKIGLVQTLTFADGTTLETAIRKQPVAKVEVNATGATGNDVGLKAHHGGVDKALFFMSDKTFEKLTAVIGKDFDWRGTAVYGENFVVSQLDESNVCVGDRYQIGSTILEVSQPRKPCERLSKNTDFADTQKIVRETGYTGWYVRVIQTGEIQQGNEIKLLERPYPDLNMMYLNQLVSGNTGNEIKSQLEAVLNYEKLAEAFKRTVRAQLARLS
ncbi:molybdenum cofactor sulfurase [Pasteurellaceae bacterium Pebbles2]|nr:molybdenum cofactor sulfurase [Pasteurellaceae bacterium Pebbles2]